MEPMTLGSAPSSPASPGVHPNFLPGFLMGDISQNTPNNMSPGRSSRTPDAYGMRKIGQQSTPLYPKHLNSSTLESPAQQAHRHQQQQQFTPHKPGPPSQGLFDTIEQRKKPTSPIMNNSAAAVHFSESTGPSRAEFECSRTFADTMNRSSRMDRIDTHWVLVFGFPPSALSLVLAQMSNCGTIVEKRMPTQGNWLHLMFSNLSDVSRALSLNGRCINSSIMIGVSLYYPKENKENDNNTSFNTPIRARALGHGFVSPAGTPNSVLPPQNVPQKTTGLVSKAFEYVFGW